MAKTKEINMVLAGRLNHLMARQSTNPTAVGKAAGLSASVVRNMQEGKSKNPRTDTLRSIATVLKTTPAYLTGDTEEEGLPQAAADPVLPAAMDRQEERVTPARPNPAFFDEKNPLEVYASAEGGDGALILTADPVDYIPRPTVLKNVNQAFGVVIEGESMVRSYRPGDVAWINMRLGPRRDEDCIFRGFNNETGEARAVIKVLVSWTNDEWVVEQLNPHKRYKLSRREWPECYRVVGSTKRP